MSLLLKETEANFKAFAKDWRADMESVAAELAKDEPTFLASYRRIVSLQAWRVHLEGQISDGSFGFFLEAQNDALTSHVFAVLGSWRSALKALRSCIDNILFCTYYMDHPVELQLWHEGKHKLTFSEHFTYLENHPARINVPQIDGIPLLRAEYATLSHAVHASAKGFRMTNNIKETLLWSDVKEQKGKWQTREGAVLMNVNLTLLALFRGDLGGASAPGLRDAVSLCLPDSKFADIQAHMKVTLHKL